MKRSFAIDSVIREMAYESWAARGRWPRKIEQNGKKPFCPSHMQVQNSSPGEARQMQHLTVAGGTKGYGTRLQ